MYIVLVRWFGIGWTEEGRYENRSDADADAESLKQCGAEEVRVICEQYRGPGGQEGKK